MPVTRARRELLVQVGSVLARGTSGGALTPPPPLPYCTCIADTSQAPRNNEASPRSGLSYADAVRRGRDAAKAIRREAAHEAVDDVGYALLRSDGNLRDNLGEAARSLAGKAVDAAKELVAPGIGRAKQYAEAIKRCDA